MPNMNIPDLSGMAADIAEINGASGSSGGKAMLGRIISEDLADALDSAGLDIETYRSDGSDSPHDSVRISDRDDPDKYADVWMPDYYETGIRPGEYARMLFAEMGGGSAQGKPVILACRPSEGLSAKFADAGSRYRATIADRDAERAKEALRTEEEREARIAGDLAAIGDGPYRLTGIKEFSDNGRRLVFDMGDDAMREEFAKAYGAGAAWLAADDAARTELESHPGISGREEERIYQDTFDELYEGLLEDRTAQARESIENLGLWAKTAVFPDPETMLVIVADTADCGRDPATGGYSVGSGVGLRRLEGSPMRLLPLSLENLLVERAHLKDGADTFGAEPYGGRQASAEWDKVKGIAAGLSDGDEDAKEDEFE